VVSAFALMRCLKEEEGTRGGIILPCSSSSMAWENPVPTCPTYRHDAPSLHCQHQRAELRPCQLRCRELDDDNLLPTGGLNLRPILAACPTRGHDAFEAELFSPL
jgi:hypothetical protein